MPSVFRAESPSLISSHPAAEHPSPSTVTMSNAGAQLFRKEPRRAYLHGRTSDSLSSPANLLGCPLYVCVWSRRDGGHGAPDTEWSASTPPPAAVRRRRRWQVIIIYHARKLKLKGTGRFISCGVTCDKRQRLLIYRLACRTQELLIPWWFHLKFATYDHFNFNFWISQVWSIRL